MTHDVVVIGGGIIGCTAAALLAERGASVLLVEGTGIGAGASGRNSGAVQHPFDPLLAQLHAETLDVYAALDGLAFPERPSGILLLTDDLDAARARADELGRETPNLRPTVLDERETREAEPLLASGWLAVRIETGFPVTPDGATAAMARRAERAGAELRIGVPVAALLRDGDRVTGVRTADGAALTAGATLVATGPWTAPLVDPAGAWRPLRPTHGVTVQVALERGGAVLEEGVVHTINTPVATDAELEAASTFSLVSVGRTSTVGSTFLPTEPEPAEIAPRVLARGARFVPALAGVEVVATRVCARPQSFDGRPLIGPMPGVEGLWVCTGHGPWGISIGPATARLAADCILDAAAVAPELGAARPTT